MNIALYSLVHDDATLRIVSRILAFFTDKKAVIQIEKKLSTHFPKIAVSSFDSHLDIDSKTTVFFAVGGDGTVLRALNYVRESKIPLIGINTGRLGFLATVQPNEIETCLSDIVSKNYSTEERSVLEIKTNPPQPELETFSLALNEVSVARENTTSMVTIHTKVNGAYLNVYWADGLVVATPTGSTGYSLSSGGPIIAPESKSLVLTPIAPHNLNARPLVVADDVEIELHVEGRGDSHLVSLDTRLFSIPMNTTIHIKKAVCPIVFIRPNNHNFFDTLRNKLLWGQDKRN
ncbi:MAG: NAD kinase [Flavobacteriales bacterium]|nr:MAG: NAD kinase [Flavobacteriales bacterium]CAI8261089.1 MAG: NAD kinase [Flavobacteriales bacterium]|tara:strand:+ start:2594 stop:3463 length:870 start_codon:yes stop_codon:yes gene_type:complete